VRIFVTGASGFIGNRLLGLLTNHEILCLSRSGSKLAAMPAAPILWGDLARPEAWSLELERFAPDWCIHLAWEGLPDYSPAACEANLATNRRLVEVLVRSRVRRMVVAGSCWEYGTATGAARESQAPVDCGVFAATKLELQTMLASVARETGTEYRWARIFFAYGPGQRARSLIPLCHAVFSGGNVPTIREPRIAHDFIHVDDVAAGILALAECDAPSGVYNLGGGRPTAVGEVANQVAAHFGAALPCADIGYDSGFWAATAKTAGATGWTARIALEDGIAQTLRALDEAL
jgi:UDP-glucose 4-epimerase